MKEKMETVQKFLAEKEENTRLDVILCLLIAFLSGMVVGLLTAPARKSRRFYGCFNGNLNGNSGAEGDCCCGECEKEGEDA